MTILLKGRSGINSSSEHFDSNQKCPPSEQPDEELSKNWTEKISMNSWEQLETLSLMDMEDHTEAETSINRSRTQVQKEQKALYQYKLKEEVHQTTVNIVSK